MTANIGTPVYMAPELHTAGRQAHYSGAIDVYAFALVAWSVFMAERAFDREADQELDSHAGRASGMFALMQRVHDGLRPRLDSPRISAFYRDLLPECWHNDPEQRPSFEQVLSRIHASEAGAQEARKKKKPVPRASRIHTGVFSRVSFNRGSGSGSATTDQGSGSGSGGGSNVGKEKPIPNTPPPVQADRLEASLGRAALDEV